MDDDEVGFVPPPMDQGTIDAVIRLLREADSLGVGVAIVSEPGGWRISHLVDWPAYNEPYDLPHGVLAIAYDLEIAAKAALRPLVDVGEKWLARPMPMPTR